MSAAPVGRGGIDTGKLEPALGERPGELARDLSQSVASAEVSDQVEPQARVLAAHEAFESPIAGLESQTLVLTTTALTGVPKRRLLGVDFAIVDYEGALDAIDAIVASGSRAYVCHVPVHALMSARRDPETLAALDGSALTVPDGMGVVWALRALGEAIDDRVYGPELMLRHCARASQRSQPIFLYGGHDEQTLERLERELQRRFPGLPIAGSYMPPHRELTPAENAEVAHKIDASGAEVVWCGIGSPRQEKWVWRMRRQLDAPVLAAVGAAFDFISGRVSQAPAWMQRRGLEWLYRMGQEPRRLGPRYLRDNPAFAVAFARQWLRERRGSSGVGSTAQ
jgi:N-acetylglucosaminyldiphosphoundecaprenol N-acetyl-beta-D-mannosaminyltransferase